MKNRSIARQVKFASEGLISTENISGLENTSQLQGVSS